MGRKLGRLYPFLGRRAGFPSSIMWPGPRPNSMPSAILNQSSRLTTIDMGRILGGLRSLFGQCQVELGPHLTQSTGPRPTSIPCGILIHPAIWPQQIWAENWWLCPFGGRETGSPSNTMWPRRPTCVPSFILIHPTVWPQYTNVRDRQTDRTNRTDNGRLIAQGEPF